MPRPLVLFCRSGVRSGKALAFLESKGIIDGMNGMGASDVLIEIMIMRPLLKKSFVFISGLAITDELSGSNCVRRCSKY